MSKCISGQGEYSDHTPGDEEFVCGRCYVVDEEAMRAEIERLRAALTADRLSVTETTTVCVHCGLPLDPEGIADDGSSNCAASQEGPADDLGNVPHEPAETTTEDIQTLDARWFERWETEQPLADKYAGYYQGRVSAVAQCREELRRLLATAPTDTTKEN